MKSLEVTNLTDKGLARLLQRVQVAEGVHKFLFKHSSFNFIPGQYLRLTLSELLCHDLGGFSRDFSIMSSPLNKESVSIATRISQSCYKQTLANMKVGSPVLIEGPFGNFTLPETSIKPIYFFACGIGITPFLSMLQYIEDARSPHVVKLFYVNRSRDRALFVPELLKIADSNPNIELYELQALKEDDLLQHAAELRSSSSLIAGPPEAVQHIRKTLLALGVEEEKILTDEFSGYAAI